jgi:hypothetical protein
MRKTLLLLAIGFAATAVYSWAGIGDKLPNWINTSIGYWPHGLVFGAFVLAPLAWRLPHGPLRALVAVLISDAVYALMVNWTVHQVGETYILGGALQGLVGALLLMFGVRDLLRIKFPSMVFVWVLPLCAAFGVVIVSAMIHESDRWIVQGAHLLWQAVVAVAVARSVADSEQTIPPAA